MVLLMVKVRLPSSSSTPGLKMSFYAAWAGIAMPVSMVTASRTASRVESNFFIKILAFFVSLYEGKKLSVPHRGTHLFYHIFNFAVNERPLALSPNFCSVLW